MDVDSLISLCIPCHNRTFDLKLTLPVNLKAAAASPPVEVCVLNYNSPDDLDEYLKTVKVPDGVTLVTTKYYGEHKYWHMGHGYNLAMLSGSGEYLMLVFADVYLHENALWVIRKQLMDFDYVWMHPGRYQSTFIVRRDEFVDAGGFDERFITHGPVDKEIDARLVRRGGKFGLFDYRLMSTIATPNAVKMAAYPHRMNKTSSSRRQRWIYQESIENGTLVANPGGWGSWT